MLRDVAAPSVIGSLTDIYSGSARIAEANAVIDAELDSQIRTRSRSLGISSAAIFHVAWAHVLAMHTGNPDVIFGTVQSRRAELGEVRPSVGPLIGTAPVRVNVEACEHDEVLVRTHQVLGEMLHHDPLPLTLLKAMTRMHPTMPLFTSLLNFRRSDNADGESVQASKWVGLRRFTASERYNYPVALAVTDAGSKHLVSMQADASLQPASLLENFIRSLKVLATASAQRTGTRIRATVHAVPPALMATQIGALRPRRKQEGAAQDRLLMDLLTAAWCDVLELEGLHPDENFFEIGGDSLTALRAVSILKKWPVDISIADIFNYPTVRELSRRVTHFLGNQQVRG